jgi:hypothetical protein
MKRCSTYLWTLAFLAALLVSSVASSRTVTSISVTDAADSSPLAPPNTLRQAILDANNANPDHPVVINIDLATNSVINLADDLPPITHPNISIRPVNEDSHVAIDGLGTERIFRQFGQDSVLTLENLELRDAHMDGSGLDDGGACVFSVGNVDLTDMRFTNCRATNGNGGAVHVRGDLEIARSEFVDNVVGGNEIKRGGAVYCSGTLCDISDSLFKANSVERVPGEPGALERGGGAIASLGVVPAVRRSEFIQNQAPGRGGAIYILSTSDRRIASIFQSLFRQNSGGEGGAIWIQGPQPVIIQRSSFDRNLSLFVPAISTSNVPLVRIRQNVFYNQASTNPDAISTGAVYIAGTASLPSESWVVLNTFIGEDEKTHLFQTSSSNVTVNPLYGNIFDQRAADVLACSDQFGRKLTVASTSFNVVSDDSCQGVADEGSVLNADPKLGNVRQLPDRTIVYPSADSVAVDLMVAGFRCVNTRDLAGTSRPQDGDLDGESLCDAGALEFVERIFDDRFER